MKWALAFVALALSVPAHAQGPAGRDEEMASAFRDTRDEAERNKLFEAPATRKTLVVFAHCVIEKDALRIGAVLNGDFRTQAYSKTLDRLAQTNRDCMDRTGHPAMRLGSLPLAAALSEELLEREPTPLNVRLARAAAGKPAPSYGPSDAVALCVAKSAPDEVAKLFATEAGSAAETAGATALDPALAACARAVGVPAIQATPFGVRSILATAAYRLLAAQQA